MYNGVIRNKQKRECVLCTQHEMLTEVEEVVNDIIQKKYEFKVQDFKSDPNIKYRDFDILAIKAMGLLSNLKDVQLERDYQFTARQAETAGKVMDKLEMLQELSTED